MASSSEAFEKLEMWRKSKTPLKVTVIVGGETTDVVSARIAAIDSAAGLVALAFDETRFFKSLDIPSHFPLHLPRSLISGCVGEQFPEFKRL